MADRYDQAGRYRALWAYISQALHAHSHWVTAPGEDSTFREKWENNSEVWEKSAAVDSDGP